MQASPILWYSISPQMETRSTQLSSLNFNVTASLYHFMIKTLALLSLNLGIALGFSQQTPLSLTAEPAANIQANRGNSNYEETSIGFDDQLWGKFGDKAAMLKSIDRSLRYLDTPAATKAYQNYPVQGISRDRVRRSLVRFRQLVGNSSSAAELQAAVKKEFVFPTHVGMNRRHPHPRW